MRSLPALALLAMITAAHAEPVPAASIRVIDGDSLAIGPRVMRLLDIDAPEATRPRCLAERMLAAKAKARVRELLRGVVEIHRSGRRDYYRRDLVRVTVDGEDLGSILLREGLAIEYRPGGEARAARAEHWCGEAR